MKLRSRRLFAAAAILLIALAWIAVVAFRQLGGTSAFAPAELERRVGPEARGLVDRALASLAPERMLDVHTHLLGMGDSGSGCYVHPKMLSLLHPIEHLRFKIYLSAAGVRDHGDADGEYVARLVDLIDHHPRRGRFLLLAFDQFHDESGAPDPSRSEFHVPNDYVWRVYSERPDIFAPAVSVHPYRGDAVDELRRWAERGVRVVKWLPNAMGIDPSSERCLGFYRAMAELDMVLLTHAGEEKAVHAEELQRLGNPLLLRRPLAAGVRVIVAHCASLGSNVDLDDPSGARRSNFELFMRLFDDPDHEELLFADISGLTQVNRLGEPLATLLERRDLHARLLDGSDYPLPAVNVLIHTRSLASGGWITREERQQLNELYDVNPLLFDLVLKRTLRSPEGGARFDDSVFQSKPGLVLFEPPGE